MGSPPGVTVYRVVHEGRIMWLICWERVSEPDRFFTFEGRPLMRERWEPLRDTDGSEITRTMHVVGGFVMPVLRGR